MGSKTVGNTDVEFTRGYAQWDMSGQTWHINWALGEKNKKNKEVYHVTLEGTPKKHYFFTLDTGIIDDAVSPHKARKGTAFKFSALPSLVQNFIRQNIGELISE